MIKFTCTDINVRFFIQDLIGLLIRSICNEKTNADVLIFFQFDNFIESENLHFRSNRLGCKKFTILIRTENFLN